MGGGKIEKQDITDALGYNPLSLSDTIIKKNYGDIAVTDIDEWVDTIEYEIMVSAHNTMVLTDVCTSNQQYIFANVSASRRYAWVFILSFSEIIYGYRNGSNKFTFRKLNI